MKLQDRTTIETSGWQAWIIRISSCRELLNLVVAMMQLRIVAIIINFFTIQFAAAQQLGPDATANVQDHVGGAPDITTPPIVTATAPAITPRPTHKFSSPLPPCVLECLQKAVDSSGCGKCVVPVTVFHFDAEMVSQYVDRKAVDSQNCACVNPVYQATSRSCIRETCSDSDQELASHIQQKCSESEYIFHCCRLMTHHDGCRQGNSSSFSPTNNRIPDGIIDYKHDGSHDWSS